MKTPLKPLAVAAALLLVAGCAAVADEAAPRTVGPGWRHEQMMKAWEKGEMPGPMMMRGHPGFGPGRGYGPPIGADGRFDSGKLPDGCPLKRAPQSPAAG